MKLFAIILFIAVVIYIIVSFAVAKYFFNSVIVRRKFSPDKDSFYADINSFMHRKFIYENKEWLDSAESESVIINSFDGLKLSGIFLKTKNKSDKTVICFHGYTGNGENDFASLARFYHKNNINVLIVDDRAHGKSEGKYIGFGVLDRFDALSWINYIVEKTGENSKIFLHGISMGGATVLMSAGLQIPENVKAIIADCAFTSVYGIFSHILKQEYHIPKFPVLFLTEFMTRIRAGYGYKDVNTTEILSKTKLPVLFIHGELDNFVPLSMSKKNYNVCSSDKKLFIVKGADHAESYYIDRAGYEAVVAEFIQKYS